VKVDGTFYEIADVPALDKKFKHDIDVVVDRIVVRGDIAARLADSFETALELADGIAVVEFADAPKVPPHPSPLPGGEREHAAALEAGVPSCIGERDRVRGSKARQAEPERITFSQRFACPVSGFTIDEIEPRLFSFNAPAGACPKCDGLGTELKFEAALVVPDQSLSPRKGAVVPWARTGNTSPYYTQTLEAICNHFNVSMETPWAKLPKKV
jgi:excinuclease ABC subunit A